VVDNEEKNLVEIKRINEEVDYDLGRICNVNKYYNQINEPLILLSDLSVKIDDLYPETKYANDEKNPEVYVWKWILIYP
jgi:uncharacterized membrane protein YjjP (DUF1212 family)